jgi:hypothetical protein
LATSASVGRLSSTSRSAAEHIDHAAERIAAQACLRAPAPPTPSIPSRKSTGRVATSTRTAPDGTTRGAGHARILLRRDR